MWDCFYYCSSRPGLKLIFPKHFFLRLLKELKKKDDQQIELEKKEQGFSIYVNGANVELGHATFRTKSRSTSRHSKTAGGTMHVLVFDRLKISVSNKLTKVKQKCHPWKWACISSIIPSSVWEQKSNNYHTNNGFEGWYMGFYYTTRILYVVSSELSGKFNLQFSVSLGAGRIYLKEGNNFYYSYDQRFWHLKWG